MKKFAIIPILIIATLLSDAQNTIPLQQVLAEIKTKNPAQKRFDADIRSLDEAAKGARSWMPPEVGTGFWMVPYNPKYIKGQNGTGGMGQYMISGQQLLPNRKRQSAEAAYMGTMSSVTKERREANLNDLVAEAKKNYYQWSVIERKLKVLAESEKLLDFMIKSAEIRYKNNMGGLNAYYKAKAALGNIHNMRLMQQNEIAQRRIALNTLMRRDRRQSLDIDTTISIKDYSNIVFDSTTLTAARSDIRAIEREIEVKSLQQDLERARLKPEFGIRYEHMFGLGAGVPNQYTLMAMVRIPFARWSARGNRANVESLRWQNTALGEERAAIVNESLGMLYSMRTDIDTRKKQLKVYDEEIIPALRRNYQTTQIAYEQNTEELFTLFDAWEKLNMTQLEYLDLLQQLFIMQAELERILEIKE
ncbi:MAG: TolC family protein [Segetibacter sp.]